MSCGLYLFFSSRRRHTRLTCDWSSDVCSSDLILGLVDIYETENLLVVKADLPEVDPKDLDIRVENNILTIRGERKFDKDVQQENYLRVERAYGSFARSFTLANTVNSEAIKADYQNGV